MPQLVLTACTALVTPSTSNTGGDVKKCLMVGAEQEFQGYTDPMILPQSGNKQLVHAGAVRMLDTTAVAFGSAFGNLLLCLVL